MQKTELLSTNQKEDASITMSSREIAELVESRHDHVKRSIERLADKGVIQLPPMEEVKNHLGQLVSEYRLIKRDTYVVVAQLSPEFTARLVDRWQELESQQKPTVLLPDFTNPAEAARAWAEQFEQKQALQLENQQQSIHIQSMESYFRNGITAPQFAKGLNGVNSQQINEHLRQVKWLYKDSTGDWRVSSYARDRYMTEETSEISAHGKDPIIKYKPTLLKKGAAKLYEWYTQGKLTMKANWNGEFTQDKAVGL
ncbi:antirepressor [Pasteurellaceae bacterium Macca]|nr:antirepressor [Pasteurellaceae bacterium Macca]MCK3656197.1 antirepressor [Pasteurellaceae bacterium Macca]MCK3656213.1 antirepressor [Pasteurellaceae bacterium Macca]MCK3656640.1 antirepressor [Pasteurellaceae bacterium Macca]MCK3657103.1 antirepressor [Pasteurellaceae bacterium Macca]